MNALSSDLVSNSGNSTSTPADPVVADYCQSCGGAILTGERMIFDERDGGWWLCLTCAAPRGLVSAIVLVDTPADGCCERVGWVETTVSEDEARALLAPLCADWNGHAPHAPYYGPATRVWLTRASGDGALSAVGGDLDHELWTVAGADTDGAVSFWQVPTA